MFYDFVIDHPCQYIKTPKPLKCDYVYALGMKKVFVVPEPKSLSFTGECFVFDGFENFPEFLRREFNVSKGG